MTPMNLSQFSSVQFSRSVVSNTLRPHESPHARPPCPSPTPGVHSDSRPSSPWCHPAISNSVIPFSSCPQSLPASESFPMTQLFAWGGQSIGASALASFFPKKSQGQKHNHGHRKQTGGYQGELAVGDMDRTVGVRVDTQQGPFVYYKQLHSVSYDKP